MTTTDDERGRPITVPPDHPMAQIEEDHSSVRDHIAEIGATQTYPALVSALNALPQQLQQHFAREESEGGYFEDIGQRMPALSPRLQRFRDDHRAILEQLEDLCRQLRNRAKSDEPDEEIPPHIHSAVTRWLEKLRSHEHDESRIIADVYYSDEGGRG